MSDDPKGLYRKYLVQRLYDPSGKHENCDYFVLDWKHDEFAIPAATAYANACEGKFPGLARDLRRRIGQAIAQRAPTVLLPNACKAYDFRCVDRAWHDENHAPYLATRAATSAEEKPEPKEPTAGNGSQFPPPRTTGGGR